MRGLCACSKSSFQNAEVAQYTPFTISFSFFTDAAAVQPDERVLYAGAAASGPDPPQGAGRSHDPASLAAVSGP